MAIVFRVRAVIKPLRNTTTTKLTFNNATWGMAEPHGFCPQKNK